MSKSLGNFIYLRQLLEKGIDPAAIRITLMTTHYRQKLNFTFDKLDVSAKIITRLRDFKQSLKENACEEPARMTTVIQEARKQFESSLDDDLNISEAMAAIFTLMHEINTFRQENYLSNEDIKLIEQFLNEVDSILNILTPSQESLSVEEQLLIDQRNKARKNREWKEADRLRNLLLEKGIILEDTPKGTIWKRRISV